MTRYSVIYSKYYICPICHLKWHKDYAVLSRGKYAHVSGHENWLPIFKMWKKEQKRKVIKEKVTFT